MDVQNDLGHGVVFDIGYQGSSGRHYSRLVQQGFISPLTAGTGASAKTTPFSALYLARNDSNIYYNGLNLTMSKNYKNGLSLQGTYTFSKNEDQVSSGDGADGSANQTNPQNNASERGPSDFDNRHHFNISGTYAINYYRGSHYLTKLALNGWQLNGIFTAHSGFPFTPVTFAQAGLPLTPTSQTINPLRPYAYTGNTKAGCKNGAFENGSAFNGTFTVSVPQATYRPGIGRNSFTAPCYQDLDIGLAKEIPLHIIGEHGLFRFQAQAFNIYNHLNFAPFSFNTSSTQISGTQINTGTAPNQIGRVAVGQGTGSGFGIPLATSAGRVIEFNARVQF